MLLRDGIVYVLAKLMPSLIGFGTTIGLTWLLGVQPGDPPINLP